MEEKEWRKFIEQFVDYLAPELTPYEISCYLYLFRNSFLSSETANIRVGKRTIASGYAKATRGEKANFARVTKILQRLEQKGCIKIGDTNRFGTLYTVLLQEQIPIVA